MEQHREPTYVLAFSTRSQGTERQHGQEPGSAIYRACCRRAWQRALAACGYSIRFWVSGSRLGRALRIHLLIAILEMLVFTLVFFLAEGWHSLLLFTFFLPLHGMLVFWTIREMEMYSDDVVALRRVRGDINARLWGTAFRAWLPVFWWLFQLTFELRDDSCGGSRCHLPISPVRVSFVSFMGIFHVVVLFHLVYIAREASSGLVQHLVPADKIWACKFADVPVGKAHPNEDRCVICLSGYEEDDSVLLLPCRHLFHMSCISQWLRKADFCPMRCEAAFLEVPYRDTFLHRETHLGLESPSATPSVIGVLDDFELGDVTWASV